MKKEQEMDEEGRTGQGKETGKGRGRKDTQGKGKEGKEMERGGLIVMYMEGEG